MTSTPIGSNLGKGPIEEPVTVDLTAPGRAAFVTKKSNLLSRIDDAFFGGLSEEEPPKTELSRDNNMTSPSNLTLRTPVRGTPTDELDSTNPDAAVFTFTAPKKPGPFSKMNNYFFGPRVISAEDFKRNGCKVPDDRPNLPTRIFRRIFGEPKTLVVDPPKKQQSTPTPQPAQNLPPLPLSQLKPAPAEIELRTVRQPPVEPQSPKAAPSQPPSVITDAEVDELYDPAEATNAAAKSNPATRPLTPYPFSAASSAPISQSSDTVDLPDGLPKLPIPSESDFHFPVATAPRDLQETPRSISDPLTPRTLPLDSNQPTEALVIKALPAVNPPVSLPQRQIVSQIQWNGYQYRLTVDVPNTPTLTDADVAAIFTAVLASFSPSSHFKPGIPTLDVTLDQTDQVTATIPATSTTSSVVERFPASSELQQYSRAIREGTIDATIKGALKNFYSPSSQSVQVSHSSPPSEEMEIDETLPGNVYEVRKNGTKFTLEEEDILGQDVEAIVNPANQKLIKGKGLCTRIFDAAGTTYLNEELKKQKKIQNIEIGSAVITGKGNISNPTIKHIIHAVGPRLDRKGGETVSEEHKKQLQEAIRAALRLAVKADAKTVALPVLGIAYKYPLKQAILAIWPVLQEFAGQFDQIKLITREAPGEVDDVPFDKALAATKEAQNLLMSSHKN